MLRTLNRAAVLGFSSTFSFATTTVPASSSDNWLITGASIWQGPHHSAHRSNKTGSDELSTTLPKLSSVTISGSDEIESGALHRPQIARTSFLILCSETRFIDPQERHFINWASSINLTSCQKVTFLSKFRINVHSGSLKNGACFLLHLTLEQSTLSIIFARR